eukprot:TRINITY_DN7403_c0_g3_i1.p1 TRINITY_DN7403_c0_g3~~TRINITY_DN7403_c0_g3_i1.p1  ORF type:complete len:173 (-),score=35.77 TRINITY_DN7403_c0_g3_i1:52-570(-)
MSEEKMSEEVIANKAVDMLTMALSQPVPDSLEQKYPPLQLAVRIEQALQRKYGSVDDSRFRIKVRSLCFNLRDPKNSHLRESLLSGLLSPDRLVDLTNEELANPELQRTYHDIHDKSLHNTIISQVSKESPQEEKRHTRTVDFLTTKVELEDGDPSNVPPQTYSEYIKEMDL